MKNPPDKPKQQSPSEIAREAFRQLAVRRITPTPDAYRLIYNELSGTSEPYGSENVLSAFPDTLKKGTGGIAELREKMHRAVKEKDWQSYMSILTQLAEKYLLKNPEETIKKNPVEAPLLSKINMALVADDTQTIVLRDMLSRTLNLGMATLLHDSPELMKEAETLAVTLKEAKSEAVLNEAAAQLKQLCFKIGMRSDNGKQYQTLAKKPEDPSKKIAAEISILAKTTNVSLVDDANTAMLREMLLRTLNRGVVPLLDNEPELMKEAETLATALTNAMSETALTEISAKVKQLCFKIGKVSGDISRPYETLVKKPEDLSKKNVVEALPPAIEKVSTVPVVDDPRLQVLRDMLTRTFNLGVATLLQDAPELMNESEVLAAAIKEARSETALNQTAPQLKEFFFKLSTRSDDIGEQQDLLLRLFKLLLENVSELVDDDSWMKGQVSSIQNLLAGPIDHQSLKEALRTMKDMIYKQGVLKHSVSEAKTTVKNMMLKYVDRLSELATTTGDYHEKISGYSQQISKAPDIKTLNTILEDVLRDTRVTQDEAIRSRDQMLAEKKHIAEAELRIAVLQLQLVQMSELVREDELTGSLNRRGLDDVFEREVARSTRKKTPLCVAMLDLDDFKRLNDTRGHLAGDEALIHLVRVVKQALRAMDVVARFGGEEFLVVLPDTPLSAAIEVVTRLQRELTKQIFMYNNERILITFSAGVALHRDKEEQAVLIQRADQALYKAKASGKNRVIAAD
ncbi:MAG: GGDEF domain-containing protein [Pseudomonadota bacterium]